MQWGGPSCAIPRGSSILLRCPRPAPTLSSCSLQRSHACLCPAASAADRGSAAVSEHLLVLCSMLENDHGDYTTT